MGRFEGFCNDTFETLLGIRLNNNRQWFDENRERYKKYVHEPVSALGEELYGELRAAEPAFSDRPKISRVNRDTRFTNNKDPYKESKWILFREDNSPSIEHARPTYFFEIFPEKFQFGMGYWPDAKGMAAFRRRVDADPSGTLRLAEIINAQNLFKLSSAETYKKNISGHLPEGLREWYQMKSITFVSYQDNAPILYTRDLLYYVADGFKELLPLYRFFREVSEDR